MKGNLSRMLRSGLAALLVLCMVAAFVPTAAFAADPDEINYVSIGDSMANGYGFDGYYQTSNNLSEYDFIAGTGMYGKGAYPLQFEAYLASQGYTVNHTKLATSAMTAEDLLYLLGGREYFDDGWNGYKDYVGPYTDAEISVHVQKAVAEADVITMGIGNASFGAFMVQKVTDALGVFGASLDPDEKVDFEDAIAVLELDAEQYALVMQAYNQMVAKLVTNVPAELAAKYSLDDLVDVLSYTAASYVVNYKLLIEKILEINPDVEIVLVGLLNTTYGMNITDEDGNVILPFGDTMDSLFGVLNAYMAGLPAVLQAQGVAPEAELYYAEQPNPQFICQEFENLLNSNWVETDPRLDGALIRQRNIEAFNSDLRVMIGMALNGAPLATINLADINSYNGTSWGAAGQDPNKQLSVAIYLAIEEAVAKSTNTMDIPLSGLLKIAGDLSSVFTTLGTPPVTSPEASREWLVNGLLSAEETQGMCKIYGLFKVGNGMSVHPTPAGHDNIAAAVIAAYKNHTAKDETVKNVKLVLNELYNLVETYGPEVAAQVWAQWEEYGYVEAVEESITELKEMLEERYTYYTETALPAIGESVDALTEQKAALNTELAELNDELLAKKAELEAVINNAEISDIYVPEINIDAELGNNEQTQVPENECVVSGEDIEAELEAAVKDIEHAIAVVEALIADVEADIADMIELAEQIAAAVAELEKTMESVAEAAEDVEEAVNAVIDVVKNSEGVVDATVEAFEAARETAEAAVEVYDLAVDTAEEMMGDVDEMIEEIADDAEALYDKFITELPGCLEQIPEEALMVAGAAALLAQKAEENKEEIQAALAAELTKLAAKYGISEESVTAELTKLAEKYEADKAAVLAELAEIEEKIKEEAKAKYAEIEAEYNAQIEAAKAEAAAKRAELQAELAGYQAELAALAEDAAAEVRAELQKQIDRVVADIETVNADLAHAVSHLENAAQIAYEQIVAEVTAAYEAAIAELNAQLAELQAAYEEAAAALEQKLAELKAAYDKAVEELTAKADQAIQDLTDAVNKQLEELGKIGEALADEINGILAAVREELKGVQNAVEEILKGNLAAVEDLKNALAEMGAEAIIEAAEALKDAVMELIEEATTADLVIDDDFKYVAIGDGSAAPESYVEKLTAALNAEAAANGVSEIEMVNYAKVGNTVPAERANLSDVSGADLITVGFSNVEFLSKAVENMSVGAELDWAAAVGAENVQYVDQLLAEVAAKIAEAGLEGEYATMANNAVEAYAYAAVVYATELPELINEIHAANEEALIIIVGMYNPLNGVVINLGENATLDIGEYVDYLVKGVAVHGIAYSILTGNSIYVDAPEVETVNTDTELGIMDLLNLIQTGFASLYPSTSGDDYIAAEIADALNITYEKAGLLGDADGNGVVNTKDAKLIQQYYIQAITMDDLDLSVCDVDGNGVVNTKDAKLVQQYYIREIASFPVENA